MFSKLALFTAATMAVFVAASNGEVEDSCNNGHLQCCNSLASTNSPGFHELFSLLGISLDGVTGQVGVACSPISIAGAGQGATCTGQSVCCTNDSFNGVVTLGCSPINVNV